MNLPPIAALNSVYLYPTTKPLKCHLILLPFVCALTKCSPSKLRVPGCALRLGHHSEHRALAGGMPHRNPSSVLDPLWPWACSSPESTFSHLWNAHWGGDSESYPRGHAHRGEAQGGSMTCWGLSSTSLQAWTAPQWRRQRHSVFLLMGSWSPQFGRSHIDVAFVTR